MSFAPVTITSLTVGDFLRFYPTQEKLLRLYTKEELHPSDSLVIYCSNNLFIDFKEKTDHNYFTYTCNLDSESPRKVHQKEDFHSFLAFLQEEQKRLNDTRIAKLCPTEIKGVYPWTVLVCLHGQECLSIVGGDDFHCSPHRNFLDKIENLTRYQYVELGNESPYTLFVTKNKEEFYFFDALKERECLLYVVSIGRPDLYLAYVGNNSEVENCEDVLLAYLENTEDGWDLNVLIYDSKQNKYIWETMELPDTFEL